MDKIYIYDEIGGSDIAAKQFVIKLNAVKTDEVGICINSPGGDMFEGMAIHNAIKHFKGKTIAYIDGLAYGMASIIALACDEIHMSENAFLCISEVRIFGPNGKIDESKIEEIKKSNSVLAEIYMIRPKKTKSEMLEMMRQETFLTAEYAKEIGFVDYIYEEVEECAAK